MSCLNTTFKFWANGYMQSKGAQLLRFCRVIYNTAVKHCAMHKGPLLHNTKSVLWLVLWISQVSDKVNVQQ